jgi:adenylate cyclase
VNVAARIEELSAALQGEAEVIVLTSGVTAAKGGGAAPLVRQGGRSLRGRSGTTELWRLVAAEDAGHAPPPVAKVGLADKGQVLSEAGED